MDFSHPKGAGEAQRRYRIQLAKEGWRPICTYMRLEHRVALERLRRQHELKTLHEALDLVLTSCSLPPFSEFCRQEPGPQRRLIMSDRGIEQDIALLRAASSNCSSLESGGRTRGGEVTMSP